MPKKKNADSKKEEREPSFEEAMERIETIVEAMESDSLTLERMLENYEEGSRLLHQCQERIDSAQNRIELIASARENGAATLKEFQTEEQSEPVARSAGRAKSSIPPASSPTQPASEEEDTIRLF